jgi:hypothetical protein
MLHTLSTWLFVAAFCAAGLFNAIGTSTTRANFVRWGYPVWWCRVTGGLEVATAGLIAFPSSREAGLILGAAIIAAAALTVVRHREFTHLAPAVPFIVLLALAGFAS